MENNNLWLAYKSSNVRYTIFIKASSGVKMDPKYILQFLALSLSCLVYFFGGLQRVGNSFAYVVHFLFETCMDSNPESCVASRRATNLASLSISFMSTIFPEYERDCDKSETHQFWMIWLPDRTIRRAGEQLLLPRIIRQVPHRVRVAWNYKGMPREYLSYQLQYRKKP
jgi:hypothetical protein